MQEATIDNWQSLFRKQIINNGQQIYDNNSVDIIYQEKQQIVASVKGSQDYLVSIIVEQGKIKRWHVIVLMQCVVINVNIWQLY
ncbi:hypothetical protein SD457_05245 [Coprobacillaceae bacterium CR2/5/TPMF4]|nr:hypothetical protein SD457_05245 [Coprobacillaceae bacterium CR2/5/TPMF4]